MTKIKAGAVEVEGLRELSKALGNISADAKKELSAASKQVAEEVAARARSAAQSLGGVAAKTAPSITARGSLRSAGVSLGGASYPFGGGAAFGAKQYPQFAPWVTGGYFPFPQIADMTDEIHDAYTDRINALIKRNFPY